MKIGDKIKALRLAQGNISKAELSTAVDVPESKIASYEKNLSRPPHQILLKIAQFFNVPPEFFFEDEKDTDTKEKNPPQEKKFEEINLIKNKISTNNKNKKVSRITSKKNIKNTSKSPGSFNEKVSPEEKNKTNISITESNKYFQVLHNDLLSIKTLLTKLIEVESNKPNFNNIKDIVRVNEVHDANKYLKKGYILLELFKDDKGRLGFTLGGS